MRTLKLNHLKSVVFLAPILLDWPKSAFGFFCNMSQKNTNFLASSITMRPNTLSLHLCLLICKM